MSMRNILKWSIHLIGATCAAGTAILLFTFCSEVLFRDRGDLGNSLMTWEDFYGAVLTTLLAIGLLLVPVRSFSFRSIRVWLGATVMSISLTAGAYVLAAPVNLHHFHTDNFIVGVGLLSFIGFLCGFAAQYGKNNVAEQGADDQLLSRAESKAV